MIKSRSRVSCSWKVFFLAVGMTLGFGVIAHGQENGSISGGVLDPTGAYIPRAKVTVTNQATSVSVTTTTGSAGLYRASNLIPGFYSIRAEAKGFKTTVKKDVEVIVGTITRADLSMELGQEVQEVTVEAGAPLVSTEEGKLSEIVGSTQIANLALNGRNVYDLIKLAPGAVNVSGVMFENGHDTVVNGVRENFNGFIMNGVSNKGLSGGVVTTPNQDIVQEFQVSTLNLSAQYGNSAGAITNLVTKSGSNAFHGDAYEFFRNDRLDASDFFTNQAAQRKRKLRFNQPGVSGGGPIRKDKTFFFASYQGDRTISGAQPTPITQESAQYRNAVISALPNSTAALLYQNFPGLKGTPVNSVADFASANYGNGTTLASGVGSGFDTLVCPDNFSPRIAQSFQSLFGVTAAEAGACPSAIPVGQTATQAFNRSLPFETATTVTPASQTIGNLFNGTEWSVRLDDNIGEKHRIFGQFYYQHTEDKFGPGNVTVARGFNNPSTGDFPNFAVSWSWTINPNVVNEAKAGYARNSTNIEVPGGTAGVPAIGFDTGDLGFGSYNGYPQFFHENIYTYADMLSITRGKHSLKTGVDIRRNIENSEFNVARPSYEFFDPLFFAADAPEEEVAGVDPGVITGRPAQLSTNNRAWRNIEFGWYFNDDWKVTPRLTLNLGVRYDLFSRHKEKFDRATRFILGPGNNITERVRSANIPAGLPGCDSPREIRLAQIANVCGPGGFAPANVLDKGDHNNWGPRIGFAYDPFGTGKTAIRGGFGVSYEGTLYNPLSNSRWNLPFYSFNIADNFLIGDVSNIVYGPFTTNGSGQAVPDPTVKPSFTGPPTNPGQGVGAQAVGNLTGWDASNANLAFLTAIIDPGGLRDPYVYNYFFGVQRQITSSLGIEINYVGTSGHKLFRAQSDNRSRGGRLPIPGTCQNLYVRGGDPNICSNRSAVNSFGRVNPNYGRLRVWQNSVNSIYNAVELHVTNKMKHGIAFNANYTYGHAIDGGSDWHSGATSANGAAAGDAFNLDVAKPGLDRGNSTFDIRHRLVINYTWELPWLKAQTGVLGRILGGWSTSGLWSFQTGAHWSPFDSRPRNLRCSLGGSANSGGAAAACLANGGTIFNKGGDYNLDGEANDRPDIAGVATTIVADKQQFANGYFFNNPKGTSGLASGFFKTPCLGCNGNLGRNTFKGPDQFTADLSVFKDIKVTERVKVQFRTDFFNAFNRPNFKLPNGATGGNRANRINNPIFGESNGTFDPRQIQFSLKLSF